MECSLRGFDSQRVLIQSGLRLSYRYQVIDLGLFLGGDSRRDSLFLFPTMSRFSVRDRACVALAIGVLLCMKLRNSSSVCRQLSAVVGPLRIWQSRPTGVSPTLMLKTVGNRSPERAGLPSIWRHARQRSLEGLG